MQSELPAWSFNEAACLLKAGVRADGEASIACCISPALLSLICKAQAILEHNQLIHKIYRKPAALRHTL